MKLSSWEAPGEWARILTVDAHTAGEPFRLIVEGAPVVPGPTILEKRKWAEQHLDDLRRSLMWEPRGHADMYGSIITEPVNEGSDFGVLFMHNEGWSTMCGHGVIAVATITVATGIVERNVPETVIGIDTPAGKVTA